MRRVIHSLRPAFFFTLSALLPACSGSPPGGAVPVANAPAEVREATTSGALLYVGAHHYIETYSYPAGTAAGNIATKFNVVALCSDAQGNVYALGTQTKSHATTGSVYEYAHGGTQIIATLAMPTHQLPVNCSSDPTTGDLAVTSYNAANFAPQVDIYPSAGGTPKVYTSETLSAAPQPAYDSSGDLYVMSSGNVGAYLPAGSSALVKITLNAVLGPVVHVQWDGTYFALQSFTVKRHQGEHTVESIYRISISGSTGTVEGTSHFSDWYVLDAGESWISGDTMVATPGKYVSIWKYPAGGKSIGTLHPAMRPHAVTVSAAGS